VTKKAAAEKTVTKTSQPSKTIIRRDDRAPEGKTAGPARAARRAARPTDPGIAKTVANAQDDKAASTHAADTAVPDVIADAQRQQAETRPAGVSSHDVDQATLDQLNQQLATIRGLPQYADLERELTDRIATLSAPLVRE
jgi:hypothetical protein